jgi:hypothetical protein
LLYSSPDCEPVVYKYEHRTTVISRATDYSSDCRRIHGRDTFSKQLRCNYSESVFAEEEENGNVEDDGDDSGESRNRLRGVALPEKGLKSPARVYEDLNAVEVFITNRQGEGGNPIRENGSGRREIHIFVFLIHSGESRGS